MSGKSFTQQMAIISAKQKEIDSLPHVASVKKKIADAQYKLIRINFQLQITPWWKIWVWWPLRDKAEEAAFELKQARKEYEDLWS